MSASVLVTGGSGFIGSHLVRRLVAGGATVCVGTRAGTSLHRLDDLAGRFKVAEIDLTDAKSIRACLDREMPRTIFHLTGAPAARRPAPDFSDLPMAMQGGYQAASALVEAAATAKMPPESIIRAGTIEEYGDGPPPFREDQRERPISAYSASAVAASHFLQGLQPRVPFSLITLRLALTYGPGQSDDYFVPAVIKASVVGKDFTLTSGDRTRDFVHVEDVADAFVAAGRNAKSLRGEIVNVGSGQGHNVRNVAETIIKLARSAIRLLPGEPSDRVVSVVDQRLDSNKAKRLLNWQARIALNEGLKQTIAWYVQGAQPS